MHRFDYIKRLPREISDFFTLLWKKKPIELQQLSHINFQQIPLKSNIISPAWLILSTNIQHRICLFGIKFHIVAIKWFHLFTLNSLSYGRRCFIFFVIYPLILGRHNAGFVRFTLFHLTLYKPSNTINYSSIDFTILLNSHLAMQNYSLGCLNYIY